MAEENNPLHGKPWTDHSVHNTHPAALAVKESLENDDLQVKIRRTSEDTFRVKTRSTTVVKAAKKTDEKSRPRTRAGRRAERERRKKSHKS